MRRIVNMRTNVKPVDQRVCFNEDGLRWATNHHGTPARGERVEWRGRVGVVAKMSRDRTQARVVWNGCKTRSDYLPMKFLKSVWLSDGN